MSVTDPVFRKFVLARHFIKTFSIDVRGSPTNGLLADTRSETDGQTWSLRKAFFFFYLAKNANADGGRRM
jgi:hypothetical protein